MREAGIVAYGHMMHRALMIIAAVSLAWVALVMHQQPRLNLANVGAVASSR